MVSICPQCGYGTKFSKHITNDEIIETKDVSYTVLLQDIIKESPDKLMELLKNVDVNKLLKSSDYKKIQKDKQAIIYEKIHNMENINIDFFYICKNNNCSFFSKIENGAYLYSKIFGEASTDIEHNFNANDYCMDNTLPRTKKYMCTNSKCITHKNPEKKEAVFKRLVNSLKIVYICTSCKSHWVIG